MKALRIKKNGILSSATIATGLALSYSGMAYAQEKPNFIIIFTDDQGYNDLGCYGSETIKTPNIDRMAQEGLRMTTFYAQTVSGPSRGQLLSGRYPTRIGGGWLTNGEEVLIPEVLKTVGYKTAAIGKWDISQRKFQPGLVPNDQGFDYYFGTLGANDGGKVTLWRNKDQLNTTTDMGSLTGMYTEEAIKFLRDNKEGPFLLYLAHTMPHVMIDASEKFRGKSKGGLYGDVIEEIDWNVGRLLEVVKELGLDKNTYIVYTADNGPWAGIEENIKKRHGGNIASGSAKPLRSSKGSPYEGGFRVPCIFWAPGRIIPGTVKDGMMSTLDFLPTFAKLAGAKLPEGRVLDGYDQTALLLKKNGKSMRKIFFYHVKGELHAVREGNWKLLIPDRERAFPYTGDPKVTSPELYDLSNDISEKNNLAGKYPKIVEKLMELSKQAPVDMEAFTL